MPEESFLSEDEERLLGSFDSEFEAGFEESPRTPVLDEGTLPDIEDMPPLEEALLENPTGAIPDIGDLASGAIDIRLEDIDRPFGEPHISPSAELDMSTVRGLDAEPGAKGPSPAPGAMEDVSSEFLDVLSQPASAEAGADAKAGDSDDVTSQFLDFEEEASPHAEETPSPDFEPIDIDLQFDDTIPMTGSESDNSLAAGFEPVTEFDDFLSAEHEAEAAEAKPASSPAPEAEAETFDDLAAVERDLAEKPETRHAEAKAGSDLSTEILLKIADELSSIRGELVSLKTQLGSLKSKAPVLEESPLPEAPVKEEASGGFFDDEEDETIALTGDELDNILNTADFTEEVAEAEQPEEIGAGMDLEAAGAPAELDILADGLLPESGDYAAREESGIEEVRIGAQKTGEEAFLDEELSEEEIPSIEDISTIAEQGISPVTEAPEDTSYLETELGELGLSEAPLSEAPLVEPDLSDFDIEEEELQAGAIAEIEEELPVVEPSAEDLVLEAEAKLDFGEAESIGELEPLEPIPEIDDSAFGE
ncbi:MAG TPA: hypothetical protein VFL04_06735, partial [Rectinemataceae bacterium]|nr:hypothetical protein [Rectinemataceae bacterium]